MIQQRYFTPFNGLSKEDYLELTKPAAVNYVLQDDGDTAVIDIDGYIGRDLMREWLTGEKSENTVKNIKSSLREISASKIIVNINSPGGDLNDGLVIMEMLQSKNAEVVTNLMGFSASAATVISQAGSTRRMSINAFELLHRVMFGVCGFINQNTTREMTEDMSVIDKQLISMFARKAEIGADEIADLMDQGDGYGKWIDAETALEYGFVDELYDPEDEDDENTDRMDANDRENRMRNIEKLAIQAVKREMNGDGAPTDRDREKDADEETETNSKPGASARVRTIETLKRKVRR